MAHSHEGFRPSPRATQALAAQPKGSMSAYVNRAIELFSDFEEASGAVGLLALSVEAQRRRLTLGAYLAELSAPTARKLLAPRRRRR